MAYDNLASAYVTCAMYPEACAVLEALRNMNPRYGELYSLLGVVYYELGRVKEAFETLQHAVAVCAHSFKPYFNLAAVYYREKRYQEAYQYLMQAEAISPYISRVYYLKFHIACELHKEDEIHSSAEWLRTFDPSLFSHIKEQLAGFMGHQTASGEKSIV